MALDEGAEKLEAFADALERGEIDARASAGALQACLGLPHAQLRRYRDLLNEASDISELLVALRSAAATVAAVGDMQTDVELAWTYPGSARPGLRTTGGVAREIVDSSEQSLLVVGYSVTTDSKMAGLASQTIVAMARAAERGVVVTAVLHRKANRAAILEAWREGVPPPSIFTWRALDDEMASVHAKLLVADRRDALVTSANLTYHGFEGNFEMGVRVGGHVAAEIHDRIHELIREGEFVPWED